MNRQILKEKLQELVGFRIHKKVAEEAGVTTNAVVRWFRTESYVNGDIEAACLALIDNAQKNRAKLQQFTTK